MKRTETREVVVNVCDRCGTDSASAWYTDPEQPTFALCSACWWLMHPDEQPSITKRRR